MSTESGKRSREIVLALIRSSGIALLIAPLFALMALLACDADRPARVDVTIEQVYELLDDADVPLLLDVRSESEYSRGHIEGALNVPHTDVASRMDEIRSTGKTEVIVFCERGGRAREAEAALAEAGGFEVRHMQGDMRAWRRFELPVVRGTE